MKVILLKKLCFMVIMMRIFLCYDDDAGIFDDIDQVPITINKNNMNYAEVEVNINGYEYSLPIDLTQSKLLVPLMRKSQRKKHLLIERRQVLKTEVKETSAYYLRGKGSLMYKFNYLQGIEYGEQATIESWFPLGKMNYDKGHGGVYRPFGTNEFSITLKNDTNGILHIGDHRNLKHSYSISSLFFCPQHRIDRRWGCTLKGIISENISSRAEKIDETNSIDINDQDNHFYIDQPFYFDILQRGFLVPYYFFKFVRNTSMKSFLLDKLCKIKIDNDNVYTFICKKEVKNKLPELNLIVGHWLISFNGNELVEEINDEEIMYKIISHKEQSEWIVGQFFFSKYSVIFDEFEKNLDIFSYDNYIQPIMVYSYTSKKKSIEDYDLEDKDFPEQMTSYYVYIIIILICAFGITMMSYVKYEMIKKTGLISWY